MEPPTWQALSAMWAVERSGFGLNALLGCGRLRRGEAPGKVLSQQSSGAGSDQGGRQGDGIEREKVDDRRRRVRGLTDAV